ncbi:sulfur carrier protein ThiS [Longispora urticae]|uniref:sulfur carrier protein ThiS n=1 Tax=Longispora sp. NPDC051575 TaxID=3154943 RepID=UPI001F3A7AFF|nr:sulfur carrier protein ThiS [Longispora fulva]
METEFEGTVSALTGDRRGVAVAVNGTVVPRSTWTSTALADGDVVELLTAVQGG